MCRTLLLTDAKLAARFCVSPNNLKLATLCKPLEHMQVVECLLLHPVACIQAAKRKMPMAAYLQSWVVVWKSGSFRDETGASVNYGASSSQICHV